MKKVILTFISILTLFATMIVPAFAAEPNLNMDVAEIEASMNEILSTYNFNINSKFPAEVNDKTAPVEVVFSRFVDFAKRYQEIDPLGTAFFVISKLNELGVVGNFAYFSKSKESEQSSRYPSHPAVVLVVDNIPTYVIDLWNTYHSSKNGKSDSTQIIKPIEVYVDENNYGYCLLFKDYPGRINKPFSGLKKIEDLRLFFFNRDIKAIGEVLK